jgi:hypothetical protein
LANNDGDGICLDCVEKRGPVFGNGQEGSGFVQCRDEGRPDVELGHGDVLGQFRRSQQPGVEDVGVADSQTGLPVEIELIWRYLLVRSGTLMANKTNKTAEKIQDRSLCRSIT